MRPYDAAQREKLLRQNWLSTLIELDPTGKSAEVVGSMIDYVPIEKGHAALVRRMTDPAIRIVALTVTEGGYYVDSATKGLDAAHPDIRHDAANPDRPRTAFGAMVAALKLRRDRGIGPFTGLSCDNLPGQRRGASPHGGLCWHGRPTRISPSGSTRAARFRTRWSTASCPRPAPRSSRVGTGSSASTTRCPSRTRTSASG